MNYDVVALGEILIDFAQEKLDESGYPTMAAHPGGAPANFLAAAAADGLRAAVIGKVGNDAFGRLLVNTLKEAGIGTDNVIMDDRVFTTLAFVTFSGDGDRSFSFARKPGADTCIRAEEIDLDLIRGCRDFHFGTLSLTNEPAIGATKKAVEYAKSAGKLISFDPNLREPLWKDLNDAKEAIRYGLSVSDVVKISDNEVDFLFGVSPEEGAEILFSEYPNLKLVFVTCGAEGAIFKNAKASGHVPILPGVRPVDTTGAGDIFGGTALAEVLKSGKAPEDLTACELTAIVQIAETAAGLSTMRPGGISSIPSREVVLDAARRF